MSITIYSSGGTLKYTLPAVQASRLHQSLNGECLFDFTMPGRMISGIAIGDQVRLGDLWFYVCRVGKQTLTAGAEFSVSCEHVSYSLADVEQDAAHFSGTPAAVLATILAGTGFSAGTVTVSWERSITINEATNKRDALQQWAAECGAEISYSGMSINFLSRVGSSVPVNLSDAENVKSLSVTLDSRSSTQTYAVELSRLQTVSLGDAVTIRYSTLDLDVTTRVITLDYDPFHPWIISMTTGDYVPNFTGAVSAALEARLKEGQPYYGVTISKANGIKIERSDGLSEALFNSDIFSMRAKVNDTMTDILYFDALLRNFVFNGILGADAILTDSIYAETGDIAELTVDRLSTSKKVRLYNLQNTGDDNFLEIQDNYQRLITGTVIFENGVPLTEQATNRHGQALYWQRKPVSINTQGYPLDENGVQIYASTEVPTPGEGETLDDYKVMVYQYAELTKAELAFANEAGTYVPKLVMGAGDNQGYSKGYLFKEQTDLLLQYINSAGNDVSVMLGDDGFVDINRLRRPTVMNFASFDLGFFTETLEGDVLCSYGVDFDENGQPIRIYDDTHECEVIW